MRFVRVRVENMQEVSSWTWRTEYSSQVRSLFRQERKKAACHRCGQIDTVHEYTCTHTNTVTHLRTLKYTQTPITHIIVCVRAFCFLNKIVFSPDGISIMLKLAND